MVFSEQNADPQPAFASTAEASRAAANMKRKDCMRFSEFAMRDGKETKPCRECDGLPQGGAKGERNGSRVSRPAGKIFGGDDGIR